MSDTFHGTYKLLVAIPREDAWGVLAPLRGTVWGSLIREVSGEAMAHARHGFLTPLANEIGPEPKHLMRKVPDAVGMCALSVGGACAGATPLCRPGPKVPDCYEPTGDATSVVYRVVLAWREGRYVVVVKGDEFSFG